MCSVGVPAMELDVCSVRHAIVIFGSALNEDGQPSSSLHSRLRCALERAGGYPESLWVVSGGTVSHRQAEADVMADWLIERGIDGRRIIREPSARSTLENAEKVAPLLVEAGVCCVELVTEDFHMRRSEALLQAALLARGAQVELRRISAPNANRNPVRDAREVEKRIRDLRRQRALHTAQCFQLK